MIRANPDDLVKSRESRHSCGSSPAFGGMDSRFRGNDKNGTTRTFYESINPYYQSFKWLGENYS
jgi:hypothetical protein